MDERRGETMQIEKIYDSVIHLDEEEQIGYAYYQETGRYLDYPLLLYLKKQPDPYDFSQLDTQAASEHKKNLILRFNASLSGVLNEQLFIEEGSNAEIQHLPRYIDIFAHRHDFFEIVCTTKGQCLHRVEGTENYMKQGDITIIPPNVLHYLRGEPDCITLTIKIRKSTFDRVFSVLMRSGTTLSAYFAKTLYSQHYRNSLTFHCGQDAFLPELLLYMLAQQSEKKLHYNHVLEGLLATFFSYLVQNYEDTIEFSSGDNALNERMIEIESYIRQNFRTATLKSVAEKFYLSPAYLSTTIKNQTGFTFSSILRRLKMESAADLLTTTDMKVKQICDSVGYSDTTQFIKTFKAYYGTTPLKHRQTYQQRG